MEAEFVFCNVRSGILCVICMNVSLYSAEYISLLIHVSGLFLFIVIGLVHVCVHDIVCNVR
jgi:hypothetical protein